MADVLAQKVDEYGWKPNCFQTLTMERDADQYVDTNHSHRGGEIATRYFHIGVRNNGRAIARNCFVYLAKISNVVTGQEFPTVTVEYKWEASKIPSAIILPHAVRKFDAFYVYQLAPGKLHFNPHTDWTVLTQTSLKELENTNLHIWSRRRILEQ